MSLPPPQLHDDFTERLRFWRINQNLTQLEAARQLDIDRSYFSQVERGRLPGNALRTRFYVIENLCAIHPKGRKAPANHLRNLPVLSWTQAGETLDLNGIPQDWDEVVPSDAVDERAFGVRLRGDSMEPRFSDGDIAILLPGTSPTNGEIVVANLKDQGALCKIMQFQFDKSLVKLSSYNPAYPPTEYHRDDFRWIFPVSSIIKQLRRR